MCGITGVISRNEKIKQNELDKSIHVLKHRGPDGNGLFINEKGNVGLGHTRLSIIDLSKDGRQPMSRKERFHITFNGEIYNYIELKHELEEKGLFFETKSDTEVLLGLYEYYGNECLEHIDGMFSFVIYDSLENKIFAARDRFGEKPFYYNLTPDKFSFASEIKGLVPYGVSKTWRKKAVEDFLTLGIETDENDISLTFFENIFQLKPAHFLEFDITNWDFRTKNYWNLNSIKKNKKISFEEAKKGIRTLFDEGLKRRLRSDVQVGTSLSGGIDSSITALSIINYPGYNKELNTYSARFKDFKNDEGAHMKTVEDCSSQITPNHVWLTKNDFFEHIEAINYAQEEPFGSASILAQYMVMKKARSNNTLVMLDGQGADEYFAGYLVYYIRYIKQLEIHNPMRYKEEVLEYNLFNQLSNYISLKESETLRMRLGRYRKYFLGKELISSDFLKERLKIDTQGGHLQGLLRYCDRNSMANSVESRLPFLYHKLVEFVFTLPDDFLLNKGLTKYALRESFTDIVPSSILERRDKIGYETPNEVWLKNLNKEIKRNESYLHNNFDLKNMEITTWRSYLMYSYLKND